MSDSNKLTPMCVVNHFKDNKYLVIGEAVHTETGEDLVVYRPMDGERKLYVRPKDMFMSDVDHVKYPDVQQKERFKYVGMLVDVLGAKKD